MQLTASQKQDIVSKISQSKTLKNAPTSRALLQYLHDATVKGIHLKEGVIELEFFGNKGDNETNPRVRVNVYNLRKKLVDYYEQEGKDENWKLIIDKGQYQVRFAKKKTRVQSIKMLSWTKVLPYIGLLLAILALIITNTPPKIPMLWRTILSGTQPTNLIIGDHFGATGTTITGGKGWTRDFQINNVTEFYDLLEKKPELKNGLEPANYTYTTRMAALSVQHIQQLFQRFDHEISIRFSTQTSTSEIKEGNAIYVGPTKNKNQLIHFFNEGNPYCKISNDTLYLSNYPSINDLALNLNNPEVSEEYAIVSKYPSTGNTEHLVFFSQHDIGVSATVEYFTDTDSIQSFMESYLKDNNYFTAIFKVKGQNRTNTDLKLEKVVGF